MYKWCFMLWSLVLVPCSLCQYLSRQELSSAPAGHDDPSGWDIRLAVPGEPGRDYPTLASIPKTGFTCSGKKAGYYADVETNCQVFRVCTIGATYGFQSFLCPNGTLFNQQVFVCDWWMNVNCQGSQSYYTSNTNEKFGNLRLGPSMMTDIKKMLTYPMNNPYRNNDLNNNQFVMQIYNPPSGQPFSNSVTTSNNLNHEFLPAQQLQLPAFPQNSGSYNENQFAGSTPNPQYVSTNQATNGQISQIQNGQLITTQGGQCIHCQNNGAEAFPSENGQGFSRLKNKEVENSFSELTNGQHYDVPNGRKILNTPFSQSQNSQYKNYANLPNQKAVENSQNYQFSNALSSTNHLQNINNNQHSRKIFEVANDFNSQYIDQQKTQSNGARQSELEITFTKQQYTYPSQYDKQYTYKIPANQVINGKQIGQLQEVKQNLVSAPRNSNKLYSLPTIVTKTLTINKGVTSGNNIAQSIPSSRITIKSWVSQPSKSVQLNSKQGPYKYDRPKSSRQHLAPQTPRPTISSRPYLTPSTLRATTSHLYLAASSIPPKARLYLAPSTARPIISAELYLAPSNSKSQSTSPIASKPTPSSRHYSYPKPSVSARLTAPASTKNTFHYKNIQDYASASTVTPIYLAPLKRDSKNDSFTITKQSHTKTNHNNLTFTDILTKEKLDITVNGIVKDTSNILENNNPVNKFQQLREEINSRSDQKMYPSPIYSPSKSNQIMNITNTNASATLKSARIMKEPSSILEIPVESLSPGNRNQISALPYFKPKDQQSKVKTVSLKISVPEKTAQYILRSNNESEFDRLEILTTGSSSYLVLTNGIHSQKKYPNFVPLGKLVVDKNVNVSNSQDFVYDFLSNSINAAKSYENTINENVKNFNIESTQTFGQQFQNIDADDLNEITEKISKLTSAQYNSSNNFHNSDLVSTAQTTINTGDTYRGTTKFTNAITQNDNQQDSNPDEQIGQNNEVNGNFYSSNFYSGNNGASAKLQVNPNQITPNIYHTSQAYNGMHHYNINQQTSSHSDSLYPENGQSFELNEFNQNDNGGQINVNHSNESTEVEFVKARLPQSGGPAKLQVAPSTAPSESSVEGTIDNFSNENGIRAHFHKQSVGAINHPISDKNLVAYKADRSFYFYTKYRGSSNNGFTQNLASGQFGELRQNQHNHEKSDQTRKNQSIPITAVQFIPSLSFQLDDNNSQQDLIKVLQNQQGSRAAYTSGVENGFHNTNDPTSSIKYSVQHAVPTKETSVQQYGNTPSNLYAGPSSYSAPQFSVGRLELTPPQHPHAANSLPSNSFVPARLEDFEDTAGYPRVTPAIPFTF